MATKYGPRKKHNSGTIRKSTNNTGGSRTRSTTTTKSGSFTRSRSVNRNGTVRLTTTHKGAAGVTRTVKTVGSSPSKPKAPKFIKAKPFKLPSFKTPKQTTKKWKPDNSFSLFGGGGRSRKRRETAGDYSGGESSLLWLLVGIVFLPFMVLIWCWKVNRWFGAAVTVLLYAWIFGWPD